LGGLHIVVANAGVGTRPRLATELTEDEWDRMIDINLTGIWKTCSAAVPHMIEAGAGGSIVVISSTAGERARARLSHYVASKHGAIGLMRSLALELGEHGIRVNAVLPGSVNTPMLVNDEILRMFKGRDAQAEEEDEGALREEFERVSASQNVLPIPWAEPRDISNAVLFLVSDEARYITGVSLPVDAGMAAQVTHAHTTDHAYGRHGSRPAEAGCSTTKEENHRCPTSTLT
jgi:(+)-trans-carveol dehydrogenase/(-)-trans-carveol dehydrogenase